MQEPVAAPVYSSDEIDLRELAYTLWASKWLILAITLVVTAAATAYALLTSPTYQVQLDIAPPSSQSLDNYNMAYQLSGPAMSAITQSSDISGIEKLTPESALQAVYATAMSTKFQHVFQQAESVSSNTNTLVDKPNLPAVTWATEKAGNPRVSLVWQGRDPKTMQLWANRYASLALVSAKKGLISSLNSAITQSQDILKQQIATLKESARNDLNNQISQLEEALALAQAIGLKEPSATNGFATPYTGEMAYMRGSKALQADITLRQERTNLDPYISELPDILKKQALLDSIQVDANQLNLGLIEPNIQDTAQLIKPKKRLIIALGIVLGGMLGIFWVLIRQAFRRSTPIA